MKRKYGCRSSDVRLFLAKAKASAKCSQHAESTLGPISIQPTSVVAGNQEALPSTDTLNRSPTHDALSKPQRPPDEAPQAPKENENINSTVANDPVRRKAGKFVLVPSGGGDPRPLPAKALLGRDSIRDKKTPHKLGLGIPTTEQGVSREQVSLTVDHDLNRVIVLTSPRAPNPVRIRRGRAVRRGGGGAAQKQEVVILKASMKDFLYLGDTLELDGFRVKSLFAYILCSAEVTTAPKPSQADLGSLTPRTKSTNSGPAAARMSRAGLVSSAQHAQAPVAALDKSKQGRSPPARGPPNESETVKKRPPTPSEALVAGTTPRPLTVSDAITESPIRKKRLRGSFPLLPSLAASSSLGSGPGKAQRQGTQTGVAACEGTSAAVGRSGGRVSSGRVPSTPKGPADLKGRGGNMSSSGGKVCEAAAAGVVDTTRNSAVQETIKSHCVINLSDNSPPQLSPSLEAGLGELLDISDTGDDEGAIREGRGGNSHPYPSRVVDLCSSSGAWEESKGFQSSEHPIPTKGMGQWGEEEGREGDTAPPLATAAMPSIVSAQLVKLNPKEPKPPFPVPCNASNTAAKINEEIPRAEVAPSPQRNGKVDDQSSSGVGRGGVAPSCFESPTPSGVETLAGDRVEANAPARASEAESPKFPVASIAMMNARTGPRENRAGGVVRVYKAFTNRTYRVKLIVGTGRMETVPEALLSPYRGDALSPVSTRSVNSRKERRRGSGNRSGCPRSVAASPASHKEGARQCQGQGQGQGGASSPRSPKIGAGVVTAPGVVPGDRVAVLHEAEWSLGSVAKLHPMAPAKVVFDDGSEAFVELSNDAQDWQLLHPPGVEGGTRDMGVAGGALRGSSGVTGRVLRSSREGGGGAMPLQCEWGREDYLRLSAPRAEVLLDSAPGRLVGLTYKELHQSSGGWWVTVVRKVSEEKGLDGRPLWVLVEQLDPESLEVFPVERLTTGLLACLRQWDRQREKREAGLKVPRQEGEKAQCPTKPSSKSTSPSSSVGTRVNRATVMQTSTTDPAKKERRRELRSRGQQPRSPVVADASSSGPRVIPSIMKEKEKSTSSGELARREKTVLEALKGHVTQRCPYCSRFFTATEHPGDVQKHLTGCQCQQSQSQSAMGEQDLSRGTGCEEGRHATPCQLPFDGTVSSNIVIGISSKSLPLMVAVVEELLGQGLKTPASLCRRVMAELLTSRCPIKTQYLQRLLNSSLEAAPSCWEPNNWDEFEDSMRLVATLDDPLDLGAHVAAVQVITDRLTAYQRKQEVRPHADPTGTQLAGTAAEAVVTGGAPTLPLLLSAGDGPRDALKKVGKWTAKTWYKRSGAALSSALDTDACLTMSRLLGEVYLAIVGSHGPGGPAGLGETTIHGGQLGEDCACMILKEQLGAHMEEGLGSHNGADVRAATAKSSTSKLRLLTSLAWYPFCHRLSMLLLESMPTEHQGVEGEGFEAFLCRQAGLTHQLGNVTGGWYQPVGCSQPRQGASGAAMLIQDL